MIAAVHFDVPGLKVTKHALHTIESDRASRRVHTLADVEEWESPEIEAAMRDVTGGYQELRPQVTGNEWRPCVVLAVPEVWDEETGGLVRDPRCGDFNVGDLVVCNIENTDEWCGLMKACPSSDDNARVGNDEVTVVLPKTATVIIVPHERIECVLSLATKAGVSGSGGSNGTTGGDTAAG